MPADGMLVNPADSNAMDMAAYTSEPAMTGSLGRSARSAARVAKEWLGMGVEDTAADVAFDETGDTGGAGAREFAVVATCTRLLQLSVALQTSVAAGENRSQ